ncbi:MAG: flagellar export chaperone FliS [Defluviitaleaceae bacterium]|nr:flagellar export chaperone FliS [Defluviitaleaceae bacterium]
MAVANPYANYASNAVFTASQEELTLMLYEGALKFTNQALAALEMKNFQKANELIIRVQDIIREFQLTLDRKYDISENLGAMYDYMHRRLIDANVAKDAAALMEVRDFLREFRDMWKEAMKIAKSAG